MPQASSPLNTAATPETGKDNRTSVSDGLKQREVWILSDGDGNYDTEVIDACLTKKGRQKSGKGHPSWKLYMGHVQPFTDCPAKPENFPKWVYLDDKAAWEVYHSRTFNASQLRRFWPFDFSFAGRFPYQRLHRGRPVYKAGSSTEFRSVKIRGKEYWFHGSLPSPVEPKQPKRRSTPEPTTNSLATVLGSTRAIKQGGPATTQSEDSNSNETSTPEPSYTSHEDLDQQTSQNSMLVDHTSVHIKMQQSESRDDTSCPETSCGEKDQKLFGKDGIDRSGTPNATAEQRQSSKRAVASPSSSVSDYYGSPSSKTKRQRTVLVPYTRLQDGLKAENQALQEQYAGQKKEATNAFRSLAEHSTAKQNQSSKHTVASPSSSVSDRYGTPTNTPKRQRTMLIPYTVLQDTLKAENQALKEQLASAQETAVQLERYAIQKKEEVNAFRSLAQALYLSNLDQQEDLSRVHTEVKGLYEELNAMKERVKLSLKPIEKLHSRSERTIVEQEKDFTQKGMKEAWDKFVREALNE
ncbi:hypothetical protein K490DRAFT_55109 [Saccharata proteae CBS 121410]|uniref:Uncharacterized protein n=1 Tax=Saccharata proteae CBS 121410 TaxID=1314787 RepID=A0A6A5YCA4_9PEZI|nr:hypothetical protein K490DRAFT_55109 [Saccharata proteae CBS 121410]